jgi:hypothetical protein
MSQVEDAEDLGCIIEFSCWKLFGGGSTGMSDCAVAFRGALRAIG